MSNPPELRSAAASPTTPQRVTHNATARRFETRAGDEPLSFLSYMYEGDRVVFDHTFVPEELRGRGIAAKLARAALTEARERHWRIVPRCSYVATFIKRNPEFADLADGESSS